MRYLLPLLLTLSPLTMAAQLTLKGPVELLAVTPSQSFSEDKATLAAGEHQLLVRYQETLSSRSSSESDIEVRSEPHVLKLTVAADDELLLSVPEHKSQSEMERFAKQPQFTLTGTSSAPVQDEIKLKGFLLGVDYNNLLADYNRGNGPAVLGSAQATGAAATATAVATTAAVAAVATPALTTPAATTQGKPAVLPTTSHEQALKDLYLKATPEERKRFISWAVQQF